MRYWLIMPAAGVGRRFGDPLPKQYAALQGRTVLEWSLAPFLADVRCCGAVVVLAKADSHGPGIVAGLARVTVAEGGTERGQSVRNGLAALTERAASEDWVLVHDAARPCLPVQDLDKLLETLRDHVVGGLLASPVADTLKASVSKSNVARTVDRAGLWRALTPQMFRYGRLCAALDAARAAGRLPTDESQALEWLGDVPQLVAGSAANIKITSAEDLLVAAALLGARTAGQNAAPEISR